MSISDIGKMCVFSGISGVITLDGKPVINAKIKRITRKAHYQKEITDETTTDDTGYFSMPAVFDRSILSTVLPMEFSVPQNMYVYFEDKEYDIWSGVKRKREENAESRGKPLVVECELNSEAVTIWVNNGPIVSRCVWDVEPDPPIIIDLPIEDDDI